MCTYLQRTLGGSPLLHANLVCGGVSQYTEPCKVKVTVPDPSVQGADDAPVAQSYPTIAT